MAAFAERSFNLTGVGEPERLDGRRVSANLFEMLGVRPIVGRTFVPQEDQPGTKVVLLNESLWKRRFGGDPGVIGRAVNLNGESLHRRRRAAAAACVCPRSATGATRSGCRSLSLPRKRRRAVTISSK